MWLFIIILGLIVIALLAEILFPKALWKLFESWKAKEMPSNAYFRVRQLAALLFLLLLIAAYRSIPL